MIKLPNLKIDEPEDGQIWIHHVSNTYVKILSVNDNEVILLDFGNTIINKNEFIEKFRRAKNEYVSTSWLDVYLSDFKWYRKLKKGIWYKHQFSIVSAEITLTPGFTFWARFPKINKFSDVVYYELYKSK